MLRRRRSAGNITPATGGVVPPTPTPPAAGAPRAVTAGATGASGTAHRIRLVPHLDSRRSLRFDPIARDLRGGDPALRIGRFTDRSGLGLSAVNALNGSKVAFKSKVVSRAHAEVWCEEAGGTTKFFIRDTKSSSGTFLNHVRLSPANTESRPHPLKDGDILQLGVDYQGGTEDIYKSVKIRVELGREWQGRVNGFNTTALNNLKALAIAPPSLSVGLPGATATPGAGKRKKDSTGGIPDCCICLFPVSIRQALFIAPCSHTFHYKCLRPLLEQHHPGFSCPLCRTFADLEEDVEVEAEEGVRNPTFSFSYFSLPSLFSFLLSFCFVLSFFFGSWRCFLSSGG
ncbi:SMAD/FHA domain-containing protein [Mycena filopes]|nr:SMAD/FHA domain-containing protein [Mycena filopes]